VLKSLRGDVQRTMGEDVQAAVITVPAAFELQQCEATKNAAQLAGLKVCPLIMEPTAAAMAHAFQSQANKVFWLVYDFGGGTFDAAVIQIREGQFRIVNHAGDNHLGGKLIDWEIVEQLLAPAAARDYRLQDFTRGNAKWHKAFAKLKHAAEAAKIQLSQFETTDITIDFLCKDDRGEQVTFEHTLRRQDIARLAEPYILRTINVSRQAMAQAKLGAGDIEKVILVGGPTKAPYVRAHLNDAVQGLGIRLDYSVDPLTVVAQGAAIFAGTQRLDGSEGGEVTEPPVAGEYRLELEYDPVGADPEPMIGGRVIAPKGDNLSGFTLEFINQDAQPAWRSGKVGLAPNGAFMVQLWAQRGKPNRFKIELVDISGTRQIVSPDSLTYTMGVIAGAQPLIHSIGVALANNEMRRFMAKGSALPARQRNDLRTALPLQRGSDQLIKIPVVEGENLRADRNRLIGYLEISAHEIKRDLPAGSDIEITLEVDASRLVRSTAFIPVLDQEFEAVFKLEKVVVEVGELKKDLDRERARLESARQKADATQDAQAQQILHQRIDGERMVQNVETSLNASQGDQDARDKAQNRLLDLKVAIDQLEDALEWPALLQEAEAQIKNSRNLMDQYGKPEDKSRFAQLEREIRQAMSNKDPDQLRRLIGEMHTLTIQVLREQPEFWLFLFQDLRGRREYMRDPRQADQVIAQGQRAIEANDLPRLKAAVQQLIELLPVEQRTEVGAGFGSGVI
jgi:molecular chaperone DnaK